MKNDFYKKLMEQSPLGYAYHKIICDERGIPCDYVFIEVNKTFEALSENETIAEIKKCSGTQFDPEIVKVFVEKVWG